jgi:hypothetical protein
VAKIKKTNRSVRQQEAVTTGVFNGWLGRFGTEIWGKSWGRVLHFSLVAFVLLTIGLLAYVLRNPIE